ncbi:hypothetical protein ABW19_dt0206516 [Dactylella cylindrospora]|nr:hypothetical protein ABW19_dt0206516 [Dactylella cylindrospora]
MVMEIGTPYQFNHVTHVGFDHTTGGFVGLPPEWERVLRGEATVETINASARTMHPPNPYHRQSGMSTQRHISQDSRRRRPSCFMSLLGRCFGSQSTYDVDNRPTSASRVVSASRLETSERPSSIPPPYDSVKAYDEVEQRTLSSRRGTITPPTQ